MQTGPNPQVPAIDSTAVRIAPSLTDLEQRILDYMVLYLRRNTYQPSIREIGQRFGIKSTKTVSEHLQALAEKGFIERDPSRSRGIRIVGLDLNPQTVSMPLYRDLREAGNGLRTGRSDLRISVDKQLAARTGGFVVRAPREQLAAAGIVGGDLLVILPATPEELADGEIVVGRTRNGVDYYQLKTSDAGALLYAMAGAPPVEGHGSAAPVILGRLSGLFRRVTPSASEAPLTAH